MVFLSFYNIQIVSDASTSTPAVGDAGQWNQAKTWAAAKTGFGQDAVFSVGCTATARSTAQTAGLDPGHRGRCRLQDATVVDVAA